MKAQKFNPQKDTLIKTNLLTVAQKLDEAVEMSEYDFRTLLKSMFPDVPNYHIQTIIRLVKSGGKKKRIEVLADRVGGFI